MRAARRAGVSEQHRQPMSAKAQTRSPKAETRKKAEYRMPKPRASISDFGIRMWSAAGRWYCPRAPSARLLLCHKSQICMLASALLRSFDLRMLERLPLTRRARFLDELIQRAVRHYAEAEA
jgi:hypothetical protein